MERRKFLKALGLSVAGILAVGKITSVDKVQSNFSTVAKPKGLKTKYTAEFAEDMRLYHGVDAVEELKYIMCEELGTTNVVFEESTDLYGLHHLTATLV